MTADKIFLDITTRITAKCF